VVFMNDQRKAVGQHIFFVGYGDLRTFTRHFFYQPRLGGYCCDDGQE
jgi:hypothetical protein